MAEKLGNILPSRGNPQLSEALPPDLFDRLISPDSLRAGLARVLQRSPMPGPDGVRIDQFAEQADAEIALLAASLRDGRYTPGGVRRFSVPKDNGAGMRELGMLCAADRVVQSAAVLLLAPAFERLFEPDSYGYRIGRSVDMAVRRISALQRQGYGHVVEADIKSFFDSVPHGPMVAELARYSMPPPLLQLIWLWLNQSATPGVGLVQGAPISPLLANLYLDQVDEAVSKGGGRIVRYADDFIVLTRSREAAERQLHGLHAQLAAMGLILHPSKSRVTSFDQGFDFLGNRFVKSLVLDDPMDPDEEQWEADFKAAMPAGADPGPIASRIFRNRDFGTPERVPDAPPIAEVATIRAELSPRVRTLHLAGRGRMLDAKHSTLLVREGEQILWQRLATTVDRIDIGPHARFTDAGVRLALETDTDIFFVDGHGLTTGHATSGLGAHARTHLQQARHALDDALALALAQRFIAGKIDNQRRVLQRWRYNSGGRATREGTAADRAAKAAIDTLKRLRGQVAAQTNLPSILGIEGQAAKIMRRRIDVALIGWEHDRRVRRPAPDPVNAVMNMVAHLLARDIHVLVRRHGLHPGIGILHQSANGRDSLAYDLMEEFRAPVCDALVLTLFNSQELQAQHFFEQPDGDRRWWMTPDAMQRIIRRHAEWMQRAGCRDPAGGPGRVSWRAVIETQVVRLKQHVLGTASYAPYRIEV